MLHNKICYIFLKYHVRVARALPLVLEKRNAKFLQEYIKKQKKLKRRSSLLQKMLNP
jgi:hypothetical protein